MLTPEELNDAITLNSEVLEPLNPVIQMMAGVIAASEVDDETIAKYLNDPNNWRMENKL